MSFPETRTLAPHDPPMLMVDEVLSWDDDHLTAAFEIREDNLFYRPGWGVPTYVLFEVMAQSISVMDGLERRASGEGPKIGFLLGSRKFSTDRQWLVSGERVQVSLTSLMNEGEMRSFSCEATTLSGEPLAQATLNVFGPDDPDAFLASQKQ